MHHRLALIITTLLLCAAALHAKPFLQPGDRMVFLGDSITEQKIHTRYVMSFFALRYPDLKVTFRNAGWVSDTAPGGLKRLERDVLSLKPTVVSICYGMNDGGVGPFNRATYTRYMNGMCGLVDALKKAGVRVVLLTPGCVDPDRPNWNSHERMVAYNPTLGKLAEGVELLAKRERLPVFNIHTLMLEVQTRAKAQDPKFYMIRDGVHPAAPGQALMAYGLEKALGGDDLPSGLEIDGAKIIADRCRVENLQRTEDSLTFTRTDEALPAWMDPDAAVIQRYFPAIPAMSRYPFKVTGLKSGAWKLTVEGREVRVFSAEELAAGVDLSVLPGPWRKLGGEVNQLCADQESLYFTRWRTVSLGDPPPGGEAERKAKLAKLDEQIAEKETARAKAVSHRTWKWELSLQK